ncbi:MAG: acetyl-CoA carboxyl transferase, partial [Micrococcaceae bacterium]|nr:acetyl-CoA carboxyl transferase [Micrococcaceae bacterium]
MSSDAPARHLTALELIDAVLDTGSFASWDSAVPTPYPGAT